MIEKIVEIGIYRVTFMICSNSIRQKINLDRVDLVIKIQRILKAKKVHGKFENKSCVSWKIEDQKMEKEDLIIDGEYKEITDETT